MVPTSLQEFKTTPSGQLTVRDFRAVWLESEADPPAFSKARKRVKHTVEGKEDTKEGILLAKQESAEIEEAALKGSQLMLPPKKRKRQNEVEKVASSSTANEGNESAVSEENASAASENGEKSPLDAKQETLSTEDNELADELNSLMKDEALLKEAEKYEQSMDYKVDPGDADLASVDDDEIEAMLLNATEVEVKTKVWYEFNKDYLEEQRIKKEKEIMDRKNGVYKRAGPVRLASRYCRFMAKGVLNLL